MIKQKCFNAICIHHTHTSVPTHSKNQAGQWFRSFFRGSNIKRVNTRVLVSTTRSPHVKCEFKSSFFCCVFFSSIHSSTKTKQQLTKRLSVNEHLSLYTFRTLTRFSYQEKHPHPSPQKKPYTSTHLRL